MPRDCTALPYWFRTNAQSRSYIAVSHTNMPKNNNNKTKLNKDLKRVTRDIKRLRVKPKTSSKFSVGELTGFLPANVSYKSATDIGVALGNKMVAGGPEISTKNRVYTVRNRELIDSEIAGATSFTLRKFIEINPGLSETFPWLSGIATNYTEYKFKRLVFRYITRSPTTKQGSVLFSPLYDPLDPAPPSEQAASSIRGTVEGPVWNELVLVADHLLSDAYKRYFIRQGPVAADLKTYDPLALVLFTNDCVDASPIGKLWVEYEIDFFEPTSPLSEGASKSKPSGLSVWTSSLVSTPQLLVLGNNTLNLNQLESKCDALHILPRVGLDGAFYVPPGCYLITGFLSLSNSIAELTTFSCYITKNGVVVAENAQFHGIPAGNGLIQGWWQDCIKSNGTDLFALKINITNAATGTLYAWRAALSIEVCSS